MPSRIVAITGATGFIGRHLLEQFSNAGWSVRALARRPEMLRRTFPQICAVKGGLDDWAALDELAGPATHIVHAAGLVATMRRDEFYKINVEGTRAMLDAAKRAPAASYFLHVSSLAARQPHLSAYAESKRQAEKLVAAMPDGRSCIVRPPAVYGPGDRATLPLFAQMAKGFLIMPARRDLRFSMIYVRDLARLILALCEQSMPSSQPIEPDDGAVSGYSWRELAKIAEGLLRRNIKMLSLGAAAYGMIAVVCELIAWLGAGPPLLSREKVAELFFENWLCDPATVPALNLCPTRVDDGFARTFAWYRDEGWIRA